MKKLIKLKVCSDCQSPDILYRDCRCLYDKNYPVIELEFEQCECCLNISSRPADTEFNKNQEQSYYEKKKV